MVSAGRFGVKVFACTPDVDTGEFSEAEFAEISAVVGRKVLLETRDAHLAVHKWKGCRWGPLCIMVTNEHEQEGLLVGFAVGTRF